MTKFSKSDVVKLARLARLKLTDSEVEEFAKEFGEILGYVEQLTDVNTDGLTPTYQVNGLSSVARADELTDYKVTPKDLLKNVPHTEDSMVKVKRMVG